MARSIQPSQEERNLRLVGKYYLECMKQTEIAAKLGISQTTVSKYLRMLKDEWKAERAEDVNEIIEKELAKVDKLELEYWASWERSMKQQKTTKEKSRGIGDDDVLLETEVTKRKPVGDKRFLEGVQWCLERRAKYLGLDAPTKSANFNAGTGNMSWAEFIGANDEGE